MQTSKTFMRTVIAALAVAAIAAPSSLARPIDSYTPESKDPATAVPTRPLDRYTPESPEPAPAPVAPLSHGPVYWSYDYAAGTPKDRPVSTGGVDTPSPVYWSYDYAAGTPKDRAASTGDDNAPWMILGLAITGGVLLLGGVAMASRTVRARRARVAV